MSGKKILIADDSLTIQKVIRLALANEGYEIQSFSEGIEAFQHLSLFRPDVVLVDVSLSGKPAFQMKSEANADPDLRDIKFVLMSSAFKTIDEDQARTLGFDGRLIKPFDPSHLRQVLQQVMGINASIPPSRPPSVAIDREPRLPESSSEGLKPFLMTPDASPSVTSNTESIDISLSSADHEPEDDIKMLTESTIKMSGIADESSWNVKEPGVAPPSIEPYSEKIFDLGGSTFHQPDRGYTPLDLDDPVGNLHESIEVENFNDLAKIDFMSMTPKELLKEPDGLDDEDTTPHFSVKSSSSRERDTVSDSMLLGQDEIERIIRKQVQNSLTKMVQDVIPEIAEKIIREEIHRLLSNPPK